ncbi:MAG: FIST C-terminal domain-containing protein [Synergistaceae bacterium]|jgi:hypothetical protein|nr:FIST C-terminal domain-containing protein [Synergistaceae bacterium]
MIRSFSAHTSEIDDAALAVEEIKRRLDCDGKLMKNSVGILVCFVDFIETGVVKALSEALPFDILGMTTIASASPGQCGETALCILVLTSDDTEFVPVLSGPVQGEDPSVLRRSYGEAVRGREGRPSLILGFFPMLFAAGVDFFVESMDEITGGVPIFGSLAVDHNDDYHESGIIIGGEAWHDRCAFLLFYGDGTPRFYTGNIPKDGIFPAEGTITASSGNLIQRVDGKLMIDYLVSLGLTRNEDGDIDGINSFPIIVDCKDGTEPVLTTMMAITPEGYVVCGRKIPVGATFAVGRYFPDGIIQAAASTLENALDGGLCRTMLIFSCVDRYFSLLHDQYAEMETVVSRMENSGISFMMAYSGGEVCPVRKNSDELANRAHSNTFIVCVF